MSALRDQTAVNIRERGGGRKQQAVKSPEREDGHLRTMGVGASLYWDGRTGAVALEAQDVDRELGA